MINQIKLTHSPESLAVINKLKQIGRIKCISDFRWKDQQQQKEKRNIALNMDTRNIRNPDEELALQHNRGNSASLTCFVVYVKKVM